METALEKAAYRHLQYLSENPAYAEWWGSADSWDCPGRLVVRWSALPLFCGGAGGTSQGPERTFRRTCVSKPPLPRVLRGAGRRSRSLLEAAPRTAATTALGSLRPWTRSTTRASSCSWQALPSVLTAFLSSCSETRHVGQARTRRRRPSQWTTMTRAAGPAQGAPGETLYPFGSWICYFCEQINAPALEDCSTFDTDGRVCPGHRGSSRGSPPIDPATIPVDADVAARRDKRRADKVAFRKEQATAVSEALARSSWRCFYTHTCGEWNLSFRNKCWKCSSKKGQAVEVVLGVPDPVADERSESEDSESDREEHTADRIAEKLGLTQFLRRRNKKRGGRGRDRGHSRSEAAPKRGSGGAGAEAQQDSLLVSSLCRWCHGAAVLALGRPPL